MQIGIILFCICPLDRIVDALNDDVQKCHKSLHDMSLYFKDGTRVLWVRPFESARGHRFTYAVIQDGIDVEMLENVIYPCCSRCEENEIFHFDEADDAFSTICKIYETIQEDKYKTE
jgi:hypothetical protein